MLVEGELVMYVERGGKSLLTWSDDPAALRAAAQGLATAAHAGALGRLSVERADGEHVFGADAVADGTRRGGFPDDPEGAAAARLTRAGPRRGTMGRCPRATPFGLPDGGWIRRCPDVRWCAATSGSRNWPPPICRGARCSGWPAAASICSRVSRAALTLHTHFKMEGSWQIYRPGQRWRALEISAIRYASSWRTPNAVCVGVRLAVVELLPSANEDDAVGHLGPDLLAEGWGPDAALQALQRLSPWPGTRDRIGAARPAQPRRTSATCGAARCCSCAASTRYRRVAGVTDLPRLIELSHRLLLANRERAGQSSTGDLRRGGTSYVYGRKGLPCRRCHTPIERAPQGDPGYERETYWCPRCQPA